jgi:hypothetical protein
MFISSVDPTLEMLRITHDPAAARRPSSKLIVARRKIRHAANHSRLMIV